MYGAAAAIYEELGQDPLVRYFLHLWDSLTNP